MTLPPFPTAPAMAGGAPSPGRRPLRVPDFGEASRPQQVPGHFSTPEMPSESEPEPRKPVKRDPLPRMNTEREYTDDDLREALAPFIGHGKPSRPAQQLHDDFEVILRAAIRRSLAQHTGSPFDEPDLVQRMMWRFDALLSSRTYEEVVQEKTRRFRIEEVYLLDRNTLGMISFASVNPGRHVNAHKVHPIVNRIASKAREQGPPPLEFSTSKDKSVFVRSQGELILAAVIRGEADRFVGPDLDYALKRVIQSFGEEISTGKPLLREIQPHLEECLLIHSPIAPTAR